MIGYSKKILGRIRSYIYNKSISPITSNLYSTVVDQISPNSSVLDVGIGPGGAFISQAVKISKLNLNYCALEPSDAYFASAFLSISHHNLGRHVKVCNEGVLEHSGGPYDYVCFVASYMVVRDRSTVLKKVRQKLLRRSGRLLIAIDTIHQSRAPLQELLKPIAWMFTTIDFGKVTYQHVMEDELRVAGFRVLSNQVYQPKEGRKFILVVACPS